MQGTILKKKSGNEDKCFQALMEDELRHFVPHFKNVVHMNGESKSFAHTVLTDSAYSPLFTLLRLH